jgi:hypothetical protein
MLPDNSNHPIQINRLENLNSIVRTPIFTTVGALFGFLSEFERTSDKDAVSLITPAIFKSEEDDDVEMRSTDDGFQYIARSQKNVIGLRAIVFDIDNTPRLGKGEYRPITMQEASGLLSDYEHFIYPSFNHRQVLYTPDKKIVSYGKGVDKFRIFLILATLIPADEFCKRKQAFSALVNHEADPASFNLTQSFYVPNWHEKHEETPEVIHNRGALFDWSTLPVDETPAPTVPNVEKSELIQNETYSVANCDIYQFLHDEGLEPAPKIGGWSECVCPLADQHSNNDKKAYYFYDGYSWAFRCHHQSHGLLNTTALVRLLGRKKFLPYAKQPDIDEHKLNSILGTPEDCVTQLIPSEDRRNTLHEKIFGPEQTKTVSCGWEEALDELEAKKDQLPYQIYYDRKESLLGFPRSENLLAGINIIYSPEGYGKSHIAVALARKTSVLSACRTNKQAREQFDRFDSIPGIRVGLLHSRSFLLDQELGIKLTGSPKNPWENRSLSEKQAVRAIAHHQCCSQEDAQKIWDTYQQPDLPDFDQFDLIITTHARLSILGSIQANNSGPLKTKRTSPCGQQYEARVIPEHCIVIVDDPYRQDFFRFKRVAEYGGESDCEIRTIEGIPYYVKPPEMDLFYGWEHCKLLYTTTESVTKKLITERHADHQQYDINHIDLMPVGKIPCEDLSLFSTKLVSSKFHGILPAMIERIRRHYPDTILIGDGIGSEFNLLNSRGRDDLKEQDIVIKVSQPHADETKSLCHELGWRIKRNGELPANQHDAKVLLAVDKMNQAIGRNMGYRSQGKNCVVLTDPSLRNSLEKYTRYQFNFVEALTDQKTKKRLVTDTFPELIRSLVLNHMGYITHSTEPASDIKRVLKNVTDMQKLWSVKTKMKHAIQQFSQLCDNPKKQGHFKKLMKLLE